MNRLALVLLTALWLHGATALSDVLSCAAIAAYRYPEQTFAALGAGAGETEAIEDAIENALDTLFTCAPCDLPKQGCNRSYIVDDANGNQVDLEGNAGTGGRIDADELPGGAWVAGVTFLRGDVVTITCSPCLVPLD
jgi:hypothetical protein